MADNKLMISVERIENIILLIRGQKVILDSDLAKIYGVPTKRLNEQVKRNTERFPDDFAFKLNREEFAILRSQFATSSAQGGRRYLPYAFTEHGAIMAANVLNTKRAIKASVFVVRTFVKLRELLTTHADLARKLAAFTRNLLLATWPLAIGLYITIGFKAKEARAAYRGSRKGQKN
jgi:phage regulator Rha-like protein